MLKILSFMALIIVLGSACEASDGPVVGKSDPENGRTDNRHTDGDTDTDTDGKGDPDPHSGSGDPDEECVDFPWQVETKPINMLILLDRSKSMDRYTIEETGESYAEVVKKAVDSIVQQHTEAGIINFALNVFPSPTMCTAQYGEAAPEEQSEAILCQAASQYTSDKNPLNPPAVPFADTIAMQTLDDIRQVLDTVGNCGGTPISKSLKWARSYLNSLGLANDTYILLATDGAPSCNLNASIPCESATPGDEAEAPAQCLDDLDSVHAVFDLAKDGYKTFVVGVGAAVEAFSDVMNVIAYTGGGYLTEGQQDLYDIEPPPSGGNWFYPAADALTLNTALEDITNKAISCEFEVDWAGIPDVDSASGEKVIKSCDKMRVFGVPKGSNTKVELTYMERCSDENENASDEQMRLGWTWSEHEGTPWEDIASMGEDVSRCSRIKLCNHACSKLKTIQGVKTWDGVSAAFGCKPLIPIV